ncbi:MAG: hypothetical protein EXQ67_05355 [Thermoleophilia bacterium]|nr:hypothetical protein [Thermoleophilia bacterium]
MLGCERLLREGRLHGPQARLAAAQIQAARLLAVPVTGARWKTRRGDVLRRDGDDLAAALAAKAAGSEASPAGSLIAACDLLEEVIEWLAAGALRGAAVPAAIDRLRVAQVLLREHQFDGEDHDDPQGLPHRELVRDEPSSTPTVWVDED